MGLLDQILDPGFRQPASCAISVGQPSRSIGAMASLVLSVDVTVTRFDATVGTIVIEDRRETDGSWSNPIFITLTGGGIGFQAGAQSSDVILVFKTRKGVDGIENGKLTLGANASVAAGPVGRHTSFATDIEFKAEVYSYSRSRGLFAGIALEGAGVTMDRKANASFYGSTSMTPEKIFVSSPSIAPDVANTFVQILTAQTARLPTTPGMKAGTGQPPVPEENESSVRTYGMPDPGEPVDSDADYDPNY